MLAYGPGGHGAKSAWIHGLNLPWPVDPKRDLGRFPKVQRRKTPPDVDVRPWAEAIRNEKDPHMKLLGPVRLATRFADRASEVGERRIRGQRSAFRHRGKRRGRGLQDRRRHPRMAPAERGRGARRVEEISAGCRAGKADHGMAAALERPASRDVSYREVDSYAHVGLREEVASPAADSRCVSALGRFRLEAVWGFDTCISLLDGS